MVGRQRGSRGRAAGFTVPELLITMLVGLVLTAIAVPQMNSAINAMRLNSTVTGIEGAIAKTRYRAIMTSDPYTLVITAPANTYVVTNKTTGVVDTAIPLPTQAVAINGGAAGTFTYALMPNGTVYGSGGIAAPVLSLTYRGRQTNINVTSVGSVTTTVVQ